MWEAISSWDGWNEVSTAGAWFITACLLFIGLLGCFLPIIPGPLIILIAVVFHWLMLGKESGVDWLTFVVLVALIIASQIYDVVSGAEPVGLGRYVAESPPGGRVVAPPHDHPAQITIDLSAVHIWDQTGVSALNQLTRKLERGGSKVTVEGLNTESLNLLERIGTQTEGAHG